MENDDVPSYEPEPATEAVEPETVDPDEDELEPNEEPDEETVVSSPLEPTLPPGAEPQPGSPYLGEPPEEGSEGDDRPLVSDRGPRYSEESGSVAEALAAAQTPSPDRYEMEAETRVARPQTPDGAIFPSEEADGPETAEDPA
jgi:hypothetical protein